jgi:hypothetical protein
MPASPRITRTRLRPARTSASSPSSALHCCLRPHNITRRPFGGSPAIVEPAPRPAHPSGPGPYAGVPARDPTGANALLPGGGCWHGQLTRTPRYQEHPPGPRGVPELSHPCWPGLLCGSLVFVEEAAEAGPSWIRSWEVGDRMVGPGRAELAAAMRASSVVVALVLGQDRPGGLRMSTYGAESRCASLPRMPRLADRHHGQQWSVTPGEAEARSDQIAFSPRASAFERNADMTGSNRRSRRISISAVVAAPMRSSAPTSQAALRYGRR